MNRKAWLLFVAMGVIWGIPYLLIRVAVTGHISPPSLVFLRTVIGAALLLPLAAARKSLRPLLPFWLPVVLYTLVEIAIPWVLLSDAERRLSSSLTGLLVSAVPLIGAALTLFTGRDHRLGVARILGLVIGLAGVAVMLGLEVSGGDLGAVAEVAVVTVCYAIGPAIVAKRLAGVPGLGVVAVSLALTAVAYAPVGILQLPRTMPAPDVVLAVGVLGVLCTALAFLLFFALIAEAGPVRAVMITYVNPAVALGLGVALLGEPFTVGKALGFVLIVFGLFLATRRRPVDSAARAEAEAQPTGGAAA